MPILSPPEIDAIVRRVQNGERDAFTALFAVTQREVRISVAAHATSADMVQEVLQATYVAAYEHILRYECRGTFVAWLKGIGKNYLRRQLSERQRVLAVEPDVLEQALIAESMAMGVDQDRACNSEEQLRHCLEELAPQARSLMESKYVNGASTREHAALLKKTESWVSVTLFRIRQVLREFITSRIATE